METGCRTEHSRTCGHVIGAGVYSPLCLPRLDLAATEGKGAGWGVSDGVLRHVRNSEIGHEDNDTVDLTLGDVRCDAQFLGKASWFLGDEETLNRLDFETSIKALEDVMQVDSSNKLGSEQTLKQNACREAKASHAV